MSLLGLGIASGIISGIGSLANTVSNQYNADKTRQFNRLEAEKNRNFQEKMAQNNIKYAVDQANDLGISPSLVLGSGTHSLGGSQASVGNPPTANINSGLDKIANILQEKVRSSVTAEINEDKLQAMKEMNDNRLQTMKEMNEDKLQAMKDIQKMKNSVTSNYNNYSQHNYTKKQLDSVFDSLDDIEI